MRGKRSATREFPDRDAGEFGNRSMVRAAPFALLRSHEYEKCKR